MDHRPLLTVSVVHTPAASALATPVSTNGKDPFMALDLDSSPSRLQSAFHGACMASSFTEHPLQMEGAKDQLPVEILERIFGMAAAMSKSTGASLCLVSSAVRAAVLPHLLETVKLLDRTSISQFHSYLTEPITLAPRYLDTRHHSALVKRIWIDDPLAVVEPSAKAEVCIIATLLRCESLHTIVLTARCLWSLTRPSLSLDPPVTFVRVHDALRMDVVDDDGPSEHEEDGANLTATILHAIASLTIIPHPILSAITHLYLHVRVSSPALLFSAFPEIKYLAMPIVSSLSLLTESTSALENATYLIQLTIALTPKEYKQLMCTRLKEWTDRAREIDSRVKAIVVEDDSEVRSTTDIWKLEYSEYLDGS